MRTDVSGIQQKQANELVIPFGSVRRLIGWLGLFLPVSLVLYGLFSEDGFFRSMSAYYYSSMREIFVGNLCAIAVFMWTYRGYDPKPGEVLSDRLMTRIAAIGAAGIALIPTTADLITNWPTGNAGNPAGCTLTLTHCILTPDNARWLHLAAAAAFFLSQAVIAIWIFTRGDDSDPEKRATNRIYRICGWIILAAMALIIVFWLSGAASIAQIKTLRPVFWLEVIASLSIAAIWMVKGKAAQPIRRMLRG